MQHCGVCQGPPPPSPTSHTMPTCHNDPHSPGSTTGTTWTRPSWACTCCWPSTRPRSCTSPAPLRASPRCRPCRRRSRPYRRAPTRRRPHPGRRRRPSHQPHPIQHSQRQLLQLLVVLAVAVLRQRAGQVQQAAGEAVGAAPPGGLRSPSPTVRRTMFLSPTPPPPGSRWGGMGWHACRCRMHAPWPRPLSSGYTCTTLLYALSTATPPWPQAQNLNPPIQCHSLAPLP